MQLLPATSPQALSLKDIGPNTVQTVGPSVTYLDRYKTESSKRSSMHAVSTWCIDAGVSSTTFPATLCAGRNKDGKLLSQQVKADWVSGFKAVPGGLGLNHTDASLPPKMRNANDVDECRSAFWRFLTYRQPFVTQSGKFGLGPRGMEAGDKLVVLWDSQCPFVAHAAGRGQ